jgi:hypothetical protein
MYCYLVEELQTIDQELLNTLYVIHKYVGQYDTFHLNTSLMRATELPLLRRPILPSDVLCSRNAARKPFK